METFWSRIFKSLGITGTTYRAPKPSGTSKHAKAKTRRADDKQHSKIRRLMAKRSRRINRRK